MAVSAAEPMQAGAPVLLAQVHAARKSEVEPSREAARAPHSRQLGFRPAGREEEGGGGRQRAKPWRTSTFYRLPSRKPLNRGIPWDDEGCGGLNPRGRREV